MPILQVKLHIDTICSDNKLISNKKAPKPTILYQSFENICDLLITKLSILIHFEHVIN